MRWSPGPISPNIDDRRSQWENDPEGKLAALQNAVVQGDFADPNAGFDPSELPPWMWPGPDSQQTLVDKTAFRRAFGIE